MILVSAASLGITYSYNMPDAPYDPRWVYFTTDEGVAQAYASRYVDGFGQRPPGDVYEVRPLDETRPDPDNRGFPATFRRSRRAEITRIVAVGVQLTDAEQNQREQAYSLWPDNTRIWDEHGLINPSEQMISNGITREWTTMLRPWLGLNDIDPHGRLRCVQNASSSGRWGEVLDVVAELDAHCHIEAAPAGAGHTYRCRVCGTEPTDPVAAVRHQLGDRVLKLLTAIHHAQAEPLRELVTAARDIDPDRWRWLPP